MSYRPLSTSRIRRGLATEVVGREVVVLKSVGSTNDWLAAAAAEGAPEGLVVLAEEQTAGRGQARRAWLAPPGRSLLVSVLFRPEVPVDRLPCLTMIGACAAAAVVERAGVSVRLKWPNDLLGPRGKLGGVLAEASLADGAIEHAILGIGLNVNLPRKALARIPGADSLQASLGRPLARNPLARALLQALDERYALLRRGQLDAIDAEWRERLETIGQLVTLRRGHTAEGPFFARGVTEAGALVLEDPDGASFEVIAGEVSVRATPASGNGG